MMSLDPFQVGVRVTIDEVTYEVVRFNPHPEREGVYQFFLKRPKGRRIYFALLVETRRGGVLWTHPTPVPGT